MKTPIAYKAVQWLMALVTTTGTVTVNAESAHVTLGMAQWTGYGPLVLAERAGIFKQNGLNVTLKVMSQASQQAALASGDIQCAAATVDAHVAASVKNVPIKQIFLVDKSYGADGLVVRNHINQITDLKGKTIAVAGPGSFQYFALAWILRKNGMRLSDVNLVTLTAQMPAQAFVESSYDAVISSEPNLSAMRRSAVAKIIASTIEYPMVVDTVACSSAWLKSNPRTAAGLTQAYFDALKMIEKNPTQSHAIMGSAFKQSGVQFARSAAHLRWQDRSANQRFFKYEAAELMQDTGRILVEEGVVANLPDDLMGMVDSQFVQ